MMELQKAIGRLIAVLVDAGIIDRKQAVWILEPLDVSYGYKDVKRFHELEEDLSSILKKAHLPKGCYYFMVESEGEK